MNQRRRMMMANALNGGNPLTGGIKPSVTRGAPGMSNPIAFGPPPVTGGTPGAANPIAFQQNAQRILQGGGRQPPAAVGGFQPPAPTLPPVGGGMANPMAMRQGGNPFVEAQGNPVQPPAMQNPMVRPGMVPGNPGQRPAAPAQQPYFIM